mmetsp:Transcript_3055/g.5154  ORF Transcript_3055/g.5154 Transcript_3055/m.5154 type:complete len:196 (-) Transcript_3055:2161-2748(-)
MMEFKVLKCLLDRNFDDLLKQFGFDKSKALFEVYAKFSQDPNQSAEQKNWLQDLGQKLNKQPEKVQSATKKPAQANIMQQNFNQMTAEGAADFFSQLGQKEQAAQKEAQQVAQKQASEKQALQAQMSTGGAEDQKKQTFVQETVSRNINWDEGSERLIKQNLLFGELENAARVALKGGRTTEALLIAEAGGPDLY